MAFSGRPYGLTNLGNTCYLNSLLQCLNAVGLASIMQEPTKAGRSTDARGHACRGLYSALRATLRVMASPGQSPILRPQTFVASLQRSAPALGRPDFAGWSQNDVAELYSLLGQCIHEATKKSAKVELNVQDERRMTPIDKKCAERLVEFVSKEHSVAARALAGIEAGVITKLSGEYLSAKAETFYVLDVPVPPNAHNVQDCVLAFGKESQLVGENQYRLPGPPEDPDHGELIDAVQRHIIWMAPQFLVVETRLYRASHRQGHIQKGYEKLEASPTLVLPVWTSGRELQVRYQLCAVAYHRGGSRQGGHYTAVVCNKKGQKWNCNDTYVAPLPPKAKWPTGGYCFFYRKIL